MEIQKLEVTNLKRDDRVETGPVQFAYDGREDWPGFFIRGDNAFAIRMAIGSYLLNPHDVLAKIQLRAFAQELDGCNMNQTLVKQMQQEDIKANG